MAKDLVIISKSFYQLNNKFNDVIYKGLEDMTDDLLRVATERAPVKTQTLEQSGTSKLSRSGTVYTGQVSFRARRKGYNYAVKMDQGKYKLGDKSLQKSGRGVRSIFTNQTLKVGTGYLTDTANKCEDGYKEYLQSKLNNEIKKLES